MAFNLGELLDNMELDLPDSAAQPTVTPQKKGFNLVTSITAYLIGVSEEKFSEKEDALAYDASVFARLDKEEKAKIIRALCRVRTGIEKNYTKIYKRYREEYLSIMHMPEYVPTDDLKYLDSRMKIYSFCDNPQKLLVEVNRLISARINNCKDLYPSWLFWDYMRNIFIMPKGTKEAGTKEAYEYYRANYQRYPFHIYINWHFHENEDTGNILYNDAKFVPMLYEQNGDAFTDMSKVSDVSERTKISIYDFIERSKKVVALVDCENSNPYALCAALDGLDKDARDKISKIILIDDVHAASAWRHLKDFISVPVEYKLTERVIDNKSLVDMTLAVQACRDCFVNAVDAFLLVSSDSDFWALISALPEADFVVLVEHEKCSYDLKTKLLEQGICYAYIDDFYSANSTRIMEGVLKAEIQEELDKMVSFNMREIMVEKMKKGQMYMSENEKSAFYGKYLQSAKLVIDDEGNAKIEIKK